MKPKPKTRNQLFALIREQKAIIEKQALEIQERHDDQVTTNKQYHLMRASLSEKEREISNQNSELCRLRDIIHTLRSVMINDY